MSQSKSQSKSPSHSQSQPKSPQLESDSTQSSIPALALMLDGSDQPITIHKAVEADLPVVIDIYNENVAGKQVTADLEPVTTADRQEWFDRHQNDNSRPIYVVKNQTGEIMAWGSFGDFKSRPAYHITSEISIYVSSQYQRLRLATLLLDWMTSQAPKLGIKTVVALIFTQNKPSMSLFERSQFNVWGRLPNVCDMNGFTADIVIMGKEV